MRRKQGVQYVYLYGGAIGDALLGAHLGRVLAASVPGATLTMIATRKNPLVVDLMRLLPHIRHVVLEKSSARAWGVLFSVLGTRACVAVYEPVTADMPLWWKAILWAYGVNPKSKEVHYHMRGHARPAHHRVTPLEYDCAHVHLFETQQAILEAWGVSHVVDTLPELPRPTEQSRTERTLLFHFFAGQYRRGIPDTHAHELLVAARKAYPDHLFIITCTTQESVRAEAICESVSNCRVMVEPNAETLCALLAFADACVAVASGVAHMAAHLHVPLVALSNLSDPCWLPVYSPRTTIVAAREECRCSGNKTGVCTVETPEGEVYRCLYFIKTQEVLEALHTYMS